jgi:hypothetical protein
MKALILSQDIEPVKKLLVPQHSLYGVKLKTLTVLEIKTEKHWRKKS